MISYSNQPLYFYNQPLQKCLVGDYKSTSRSVAHVLSRSSGLTLVPKAVGEVGRGRECPHVVSWGSRKAGAPQRRVAIRYRENGIKTIIVTLADARAGTRVQLGQGPLLTTWRSTLMQGRPLGSVFWPHRKPETAQGNYVYGNQFLRNGGPAHRLVSHPLADGEPSNACLAQFALRVADEVANEEEPVDLCMQRCVARAWGHETFAGTWPRLREVGECVQSGQGSGVRVAAAHDREGPSSHDVGDNGATRA